MQIWVLGLVIVVLALLGVVAWLVYERQRSERLRSGFGSEYDRTVAAQGDRRAAEAELAARQERVEALRIHPLAPGERQRFADDWRRAQTRFVDDPGAAIGEADRLVASAMQARGYPVGDFEQRAADISVKHHDVVEHYRAAHAIALNNERGAAETEDLRQGMVHYRALFADLLEDHVGVREEARS